MLPVIFKSTEFILYAYPLFMGLAWGLGYYLTQYLFDKNGEDSTSILKLYLGVFVSAWIGAKLFFLIFSFQQSFFKYLYADYFWLGGGFVFYGGLILGLIFFLIYSLGFKKFNFQNSYLLFPGLIFGHAVGRVGCFLTGCCYGAQCSLPWAVNVDGVFRHPVQLYEALALFCLGLITLTLIKKKKKNLYIISNYFIFYSSARFIIEFFRGDEGRGIFWLSLSTSQLISIALLLTTLIVKFKWNKD